LAKVPEAFQQATLDRQVKVGSSPLAITLP
jgi:hypothetical protein